jgi:hypothetical protein
MKAADVIADKLCGPYALYILHSGARWDFLAGAGDLEWLLGLAENLESPWKVKNRFGRLVDRGHGDACFEW